MGLSMRRSGRLPLLIALVIVLGALPAAAQSVHVEVRSAAGVPLGQLTGTPEGKVTYFALPEVARMVGGTVRRRPGGDRATLTVRGKAIGLRRDSARVTVEGRQYVLSAPVRVRQRIWLVPGELLVTGLPAALGSGIQIRVGPGPQAAPGVRAAVTPVSLPPQEAEPSRGKLFGATRAETGVARAVTVRHRTYPTHTRVVIEGLVGGALRVAEGERSLVVTLAGAAGLILRTTHPVRDGLVALVELAETRGEPVLHVTLEQSPGRHKLYRLPDPPRLVLDLYRASSGPTPAGPREAPSASPPPPAAREATPGPSEQAEKAPPPPTQAAEAEEDAAEGVATAPVKAGPLEVRYRSYPTYTRVVVEGAGPFEPRLVESGGALVVPLAGLTGPVPRTVRAVRDGLIAALELGATRGQPALRVSFERPPGTRKVYRLQDPPRVVLDFYRAAPAPATAPTDRTALQTIVIDPGHGGHDPGAVGPGGLQEKELTLDIARRVAALVQDELGVKVVLTRTRDQFVALRERTAFANRQRGDLFLSIHVNAAPGATATCTETYFLSSEATDNAARAAAAFENKVIALEAGPRGGARDILRSILWDLAQSEFQQESSRLAEALQDSLERALRQPSRGVKQAPFYVLGGAAMPAVLVEIGFLTNLQEEQRLRDEGHRDRIARALAAGLVAYKRHYDHKSGVIARR